MPIDMSYSDEVRELTSRTTAFIREYVIPIDDAHDGDITRAGGDIIRVEMQQAAKEAGVFVPHAPVAYGGHGLGMSDRAPVFEAAGYSLFGPAALNIASPDEGNLHLLAHVASPEQQEQFLAPLAAGEVRSAFAMTEPAPGAGADPNGLNTLATRVTGGWRVKGRKHFITGADGAGFFIVMARTSGVPGDRGGATMFLTSSSADGLTVGDHITTIDRSLLGGHCVVDFEDVFVPDSAVLGEVDQGFQYAQVRLGPARMTHVMRWLGAARRAHDVAIDYVIEREAFGGKLSELGMVQKMIADNEIDIAATRGLLRQACWELDQGSTASQATSVAKAFASEAIFRIVDRAMQLCGGLGVSDQLPVARIFREVRPFRIYDGPSEVHRWAIAKRAVRAATKAAGQAKS